MPSPTSKFIPAIGTKGSFQLLTPFDALVSVLEQYTLRGVRNISDWLAENQDIKTLVYTKYNIESSWNDDLQNDVEILSLQGEHGAWIYVPVTFVKCYPISDGIPYRALMICLPLQPVPVDTDLSALFAQLEEVCLGELGFNVTPVTVEASRAVLVPDSAHATIETDRAVLANQSTPWGMINTLNAQLSVALAKVAALEQYIKTHP
jgi:hypothetical protein